MFRSVAAATKAAIEGENAEFDTQQCLHMQADILSSSPPQSPERAPVAFAGPPETRPSTASNLTSNPRCSSPLGGRTDPPPHHGRPHSDTNVVAASSSFNIPAQPPNTQSASPVTDGRATTTVPLQHRIAKNSQGVFRLHDTDGNEVGLNQNKTERFDGLPRPFDTAKPQEQPRNTKPTMYTQTQRENWSPTQENTPSVYARYNFNVGDEDLENSLPDDFTTDPLIGNDQRSDNPNQASGVDYYSRLQRASTVTDSTAQTYKEQDTGHINLDGPAPGGTQLSFDEIESQDVASQDASDVPRPEEFTQNETSQFNPETPAPPVNPFMRKGSVMKVHELFGATQPSSPGRLASPTSSRPSPDVFNAMQTPSGLRSSPLVRRFDAAPASSPLHASVRNILAQPRHSSFSLDSQPSTTILATPGIQSSKIRREDSLQEPQVEYVSMKESQERRAKLTSSMHCSDDDDSDTDSGARRRNRRRKTEREAQKELSAVEIIRASGSVTSSRDVVVPSTGRRRRSVQEEYIAQCEGLDARDTQEDDGIIADSQGQIQTEADSEEPLEKVASSWQEDNLGGPTTQSQQSQQSQHLPSHVARIGHGEPVPELDSNSNTREATSEPPRSPEQHSTLPLQELNANCNSSGESLLHKMHMLSDVADSTVPETSPPARLRPMGEIASLSFSAAIDDELYQDIPGLTQDHDYNRLMGSSPPAEHVSSQRKRPSRSDKESITSSKEMQAAEPQGISDKNQCGPSELPVDNELPISDSPNKEPTPPEASRSLENSVGQDAGPSEAPLSTSNNDKTPVKARVRPEAKARIATDALNRAQERRESKIAFRKEQIREGTTYEPDESDHDEVVQAALQTFRAELASRVKPATPIPKLLEQSSPDPLSHAGEVNTTLGEFDGHPNESSKQLGDETPRRSRLDLRSKGESTASPRSLKKACPALTTPSSKKTYGRRKGKAKAETSTSSQLFKERQTPNTRSSRRLSRFSNISSTQSSSPLSSVPTSVGEEKETNSRRAATSNSKQKRTVPSTSKRVSKRKSAAVVLHSDEDDDDDEVMPSKTTARTAKLRSETRLTDDKIPGDNGLAIVPNLKVSRKKKVEGSLFTNMAFAISYVDKGPEMGKVINLIEKQGGVILDDGFDVLLEDGDTELVVTKAAQGLGFVALIADEHTRRVKYMQALAMGLPCLSGRWIIACNSKKEVVNWAPYLLCAGNSSILGGMIRSRTLQNYSAATAKFVEIFDAREKLLGHQSTMFVAGSGKQKEARKIYIFLARVLAPARYCLVSDYTQARQKLLEAEALGKSWDCLHVDNNDAATTAVFSSSQSTQSRKRKRGTAIEEEDKRVPKKVRVISDEVVMQSLISGQLLDEA